MKYFLVLLFLLVSADLFSQDANYWSSAYGPGAFFTPGSVVSYNRDSGVVFCNPALLAYSKRNAASISATVYQFNNTKINDGAGPGYDIKSGGFSVIPLIASHTVPLKWKIPVTIIYAIASRPVMNYQASERLEEFRNVIDDDISPGEEFYIGQFSNIENAGENSFLLSAGTNINKKLTAGLSLEGKVYNRHSLLRTQARALQNINDSSLFPPIINVEQFYEVNSKNVGLRIKVGADYAFNENSHAGLVLSLPLIRISGKGSIASDIEVNDLPISPGVQLNLLASTQQKGLKSTWKMPFSIAAGYTWMNDKAMIYFAAEYFGAVSEYDVVRPNKSAFIRPDTMSSDYTYGLLRYKDARRAILNGAVGISYEFKRSIVGYFSFRTDFNYLDMKTLDTGVGDGFIAATSRWNSYHIQLGSNFRFRKSHIRAGILGSFGKTNKFPQIMNFANPTDKNLLSGDIGYTDAVHLQAGFMVSYLYNL